MGRFSSRARFSVLSHLLNIVNCNKEVLSYMPCLRKHLDKIRRGGFHCAIALLSKVDRIV